METRSPVCFIAVAAVFVSPGHAFVFSSFPCSFYCLRQRAWGRNQNSPDKILADGVERLPQDTRSKRNQIADSMDVIFKRDSQQLCQNNVGEEMRCGRFLFPSPHLSPSSSPFLSFSHSFLLSLSIRLPFSLNLLKSMYLLKGIERVSGCMYESQVHFGGVSSRLSPPGRVEFRSSFPTRPSQQSESLSL